MSTTVASVGAADASARKLLDPSELGTKEYWDGVYVREIRNYEDDADDEGTIWFSESRAEEAVREQLHRLAKARLLNRESSRFLDLGTGNGHMLFTLREGDDDDADEDDIVEDDGTHEHSGSPWNGDMLGVDYSLPSVELARRIAAHKFEGQSRPIAFELWDLLEEAPGAWLGEGFDVVLDKGTFDAISLMPPPATEDAEATPYPCDVYRERVSHLVKPGAYLFVTSCNWTKAELIGWLAPEHSTDFTLYAEARYPTFTFGGQTGQSIVTLVFQRSQR